MSGFALGLTTGVLAGAAVYYTLSAGLEQSTHHLRQGLAHSNAVLEHSFSPTEAPAPVSRVGPSSPAGDASLGDLVRRKWNALVSGAVANARETDWAELGRNAWQQSRELASKLGDAGTPAADNAARAVAATGEIAAADAIVAVEAAKGAVAAAAAAQPPAKPPTDVNVDAPLRPTPKITETPKRLV
ncbi:uncharacterized protein LOC62_02G002050 [Vanrija pseudolonga]|uniref:Found in mitochondrial proteome protein 51 n=1 Tax=Vanrija pseudolonga TaxID=143232 RepID=A0AAF0Y7Y0_9TREE|nr:hypothetical protein LOC62_02G002050 [Vanrija pseudolonga]